MSESNKFIGIDPSLSGLAVCISDYRDSRVNVFSSEPPYDKSIHARHLRYAKLLSSVRLAILESEAEGCLAFVEGYGSSARGHAQVPMIEFGWALRNELLDMVRLIEVPPASLKKFITGKGNADKLAVCLAIQKRYGVTFESNDEFDAYGLARMAACYAGYEEPANDKQREAIASLRGEKPAKKKKAPQSKAASA